MRSVKYHIVESNNFDRFCGDGDYVNIVPYHTNYTKLGILQSIKYDHYSLVGGKMKLSVFSN